jgi:DNA-binding transcriptional LysR family regulator
MQFRRSDFADLSYFLEIAKHRNFRRAGLELGISASALRHALRGLEERVGVRLLNRTSPQRDSDSRRRGASRGDS